jgi:hypothetical protein
VLGLRRLVLGRQGLVLGRQGLVEVFGRHMVLAGGAFERFVGNVRELAGRRLIGVESVRALVGRRLIEVKLGGIGWKLGVLEGILRVLEVRLLMLDPVGLRMLLRRLRMGLRLDLIGGLGGGRRGLLGCRGIVGRRRGGAGPGGTTAFALGAVALALLAGPLLP